MWRRLTLALVVVAVNNAAATQPAPLPAPVHAAQGRVRPYFREATEQWTLETKAGRSFEISVSWPKSPAPPTGYPVLYTLDADTHFAALADTVRAQEPLFGPALVVGIGYPNETEANNRLYDLSLPFEGQRGGADALLDFLLHELKPILAKSTSVDPKRQALFGHSLGGLFVLHVLFTHPDAFDTYIAGSPSIWWQHRSLLKELPAFLDARRSAQEAPRRVLITAGELEAARTPEEVRAHMSSDDLVREADMVSRAAALADELRALPKSTLEVQFVRFPQETHVSVIPAYLSRGARFTLLGWFH